MQHAPTPRVSTAGNGSGVARARHAPAARHVPTFALPYLALLTALLTLALTASLGWSLGWAATEREGKATPVALPVVPRLLLLSRLAAVSSLVCAVAALLSVFHVPKPARPRPQRRPAALTDDDWLAEHRATPAEAAAHAAAFQGSFRRDAAASDSMDAAMDLVKSASALRFC